MLKKVYKFFSSLFYLSIYIITFCYTLLENKFFFTQILYLWMLNIFFFLIQYEFGFFFVRKSEKNQTTYTLKYTMNEMKWWSKTHEFFFRWCKWVCVCVCILVHLCTKIKFYYHHHHPIFFSFEFHFVCQTCVLCMYTVSTLNSNLFTHHTHTPCCLSSQKKINRISFYIFFNIEPKKNSSNPIVINIDTMVAKTLLLAKKFVGKQQNNNHWNELFKMI